MSKITSSSSDLTINADGSTSDIKFQADGTEKMVLKSDGNVGIGNTSPAEALDLQGAVRNIRVHNGSRVQASSSNNAIYFDNNLLKFYTGGSERVRVDNDGIKFNGDTATANALDDYEEGTFTVGFSGGTSTTAANTTAHYTKIGRQVFFNWYSNNISHSGGGEATMTGLPFTSQSSGENYGLFMHIHGTAINDCYGGYVNQGQTDMVFISHPLTTNGATWVNASGKHIMIAGSYFV